MNIAFFDLDGTIIKIKSLLSFYKYYLKHRPCASRASWQDIESNIRTMVDSGVSRSVQNKWFYKNCFQGLIREELVELSESWLAENLKKPFYFDDVVDVLNAHIKDGFKVVMVTGSFYEVAKPIADLVGIDEVICSPLEDRGGRYTGRLLDLPTIGEGKAKAVDTILKAQPQITLSYGYGDDMSDYDFLSIVDRPVACSDCGANDLVGVAKKRGWEILLGN